MKEELRHISSNKGVTVKDVSAEEFIKAFAAFLKKLGKFKVPEWTFYHCLCRESTRYLFSNSWRK